MLGLARRMLDSPGQAEALVHDVFLEAWHRARYCDPSHSTLRSWLMLRLRSRAIERKRIAREGQDGARGEPGARACSDPSAAAALGADATRMSAFLEKLPADQRIVLELGFFEGLTYAEIARTLDVPIDAIKSNMVRAISLLRASMRNEAESEP